MASTTHAPGHDYQLGKPRPVTAHGPEHDYHLVKPSPWPAVASVFAFILAVGLIAWMKSSQGGVFGATGPWVFALGAAGIIATAFFWWGDVIREAHGGDHTPVVQLHLRYGMILFIASEVMFFVAWFWAYFDASLFPGHLHLLDNDPNEVLGLVGRNSVTGGHWPPEPSANFQHTFNPWGVPLLNTLILLSSGCTVTWAHHALLHDQRRQLVWGLILTIALGITFTCLQAFEYAHAGFNYAGNIYGATFFMATGFHGAHVIIGTIFLTVCLFRALAGHFTPKQHFGFEAAAWYWHFVDVVWLFLFTSIYVWGAGPHPG